MKTTFKEFLNEEKKQVHKKIDFLKGAKEVAIKHKELLEKLKNA